MQTVLSFCGAGKSLAFKVDTTKTVVDQSKRPKLTLTSFDQVLSGTPYNPVWFTFERDPRGVDKPARLSENVNASVNSTAVTDMEHASVTGAAELHLATLRMAWSHSAVCTPGTTSGDGEAGGARQNSVRLLGNRIEPSDAMIRSVLAPIMNCQNAGDVNRLNQHLLFYRQVRSGASISSGSIATTSAQTDRNSFVCQSCFAREGRRGWCAFEETIASTIHSLWFVQLPRLGTTDGDGKAMAAVAAMSDVTIDDLDSFSPCTQVFGRRVFVFGDAFPTHIEPLVFQAPTNYEPRLTMGATLATPPQFYEVADNDDIYLHVPREKRTRLPKQERHRILFGSTSAHFAQTFRQFMPSPAVANANSSMGNNRSDDGGGGGGDQEQKSRQLFACSAYGLPIGCSSMQDYLTTLSALPTISPGMRALIASISVSASSSSSSHNEKQKQPRRQQQQQSTSRKRAGTKKEKDEDHRQETIQPDVTDRANNGHETVAESGTNDSVAIIGDGFDVSSEWNVGGGMSESCMDVQHFDHVESTIDTNAPDVITSQPSANRKKRKRKQVPPPIAVVGDDGQPIVTAEEEACPPAKKKRRRRSKQEIMAEKERLLSMQQEQQQQDQARVVEQQLETDEQLHSFDPSLSCAQDQQPTSIQYYYQQQMHTYDAHSSFQQYQWPSQFNEESYVAAGGDPESREWQLAQENTMITTMEQAAAVGSGVAASVDDATRQATDPVVTTAAAAENIPQLTGAALPFHFEEQQYYHYTSGQQPYHYGNDYYFNNYNANTQSSFADGASGAQYIDETSNGPSSSSSFFPPSTSYPIHSESSMDAALHHPYLHGTYQQDEWNSRALSSHEMVSNFFQSSMERNAHNDQTEATSVEAHATVEPTPIATKKRGRKTRKAVTSSTEEPQLNAAEHEVYTTTANGDAVEASRQVSHQEGGSGQTLAPSKKQHQQRRRKTMTTLVDGDSTKNSQTAAATTTAKKAAHGVTFWTDRDSLTKLMFVCRRVSVPSNGQDRDDDANSTDSRGVYIEQSALKLRGIGLYMHSPERLSALVRRYAAETFKSSLTAYIAAHAATSLDSPSMHGQEQSTSVTVFNHRLGVEQVKTLPKKSDLYQWCIFTCAFAEEPFKTYLVRLMVSLLRRHRRESIVPSTPEEDKIFATLSQHRDITKAARISGVQHQQILDAYYWSFLSEKIDVSLTRVLQYYSLAGVEARLKNGYSRTGLHTGRSPALGVLREYAEHRKQSYLMAKRAVSRTGGATTETEGDGQPSPNGESAATVVASPDALKDAKSVAAGNKKQRKPKTTQSKYVMTARQDVQTPFGYDLIRVGSDTKRASLVRPANAPLFVLNAKHHIGKSVEEVLSPEDLRRLNFVKDDPTPPQAAVEDDRHDNHMDLTPTQEADASLTIMSSPSSTTTATTATYYTGHDVAPSSPPHHQKNNTLLSNSMDISLPIPELIVMSDRRSTSSGLSSMKDAVATSCVVSSNFGHFSSVLPTSGSFTADD